MIDVTLYGRPTTQTVSARASGGFGLSFDVPNVWQRINPPPATSPAAPDYLLLEGVGVNKLLQEDGGGLLVAP